MKYLHLNMMRRHTAMVISCLMLLSVSAGVAQENLDSLFLEARQAATELNDRGLAIELCERALASNPDYHDFRILLGRCHSWEGRFGESEAAFLQVLEADSSYQDARNALLDTYVWSNQFDKALVTVKASIQLYPHVLEYRYRQMQILESLGEIARVMDVANQILTEHPEDVKALDVRSRIKVSQETRSTGIHYSYNRLAETQTEWQFIVVDPSLDPWHLVSLEHKETLPFGPVIFKFNYADRFQKSATQIEVESYPVIRKGTYLYVGVGLSKSDLFPSFRMGLDVFQALPNAFEASLGMRYLEVPGKQIPIYVGSIGKYWQSYWISAKTYVSPSNSSVSKSWVLAVRKYLSKPSVFLEIYTGSGVSPDTDLGGEEIDFLGSRSFGCSYRMEVKPQYDLNLGLHFSNLETRTDAFRGDTGMQISITRRY